MIMSFLYRIGQFMSVLKRTKGCDFMFAHTCPAWRRCMCRRGRPCRSSPSGRLRPPPSAVRPQSPPWDRPAPAARRASISAVHFILMLPSIAKYPTTDMGFRVPINKLRESNLLSRISSVASSRNLCRSLIPQCGQKFPMKERSIAIPGLDWGVVRSKRR